MLAKKSYLKFVKFFYARPDVVIQRKHKPLPVTYRNVSMSSQWRLMNAVRNMANDHKLFFEELSPSGDFEVSF